MSKYAVIEVGSRQERVVEGDILEVPKSFSLESMNPILLSPRKGSIVTDKKSLSQCSVDLELMDEKKLKKINIFQYKNKTGNRRRVGYRDEVKVVKVKSISNNKSGEEEWDMSKTKAGGSTRNGRDSESKRLGTKVFDGQDISAGSIVVRQRGTKIHPGENVSKGGDDTLFAKVDGVVKYSSRNGRKLVNIIPKWNVCW